MKYHFENVLIISDHQDLLENIYKILMVKQLTKYINFVFACSPQTIMNSPIVPSITKFDISNNINLIVEKYNLVISLHCKQIFSSELVRKIKCINIHPGFNPYNRGWYPHVFSIINKLPAGVTIHEMDEKIDHGPIIVQEEVPIFSHDTSETLYSRITELEIRLFSEYIESILKNDYKTYIPLHEGNINFNKDFENLRQIDIKKMYTGQEILDLLRALTHGNYQNAYFIDKDNREIFIKIILEEENSETI